MDEMVTVHLKVPKALWNALRVDALGRGRSAREHVVGMFEVAYGVGAGVVKASPKPIPERIKASPVIPEEMLIKKVCGVCRLACEHWVYDKKGQPICDECAERLANSNP